MSDHSLSSTDDMVLGSSPRRSRPAPDRQAEARQMQRLFDGVRKLRAGGATLKLNERMLMVLGGIVAPLGLILVVIGWHGAAHTPNLFEQIPYLISGGLFGLGLVFLGAFFYFTHWITELVKEHRAQSAAVVDAIARVEHALTLMTGAGVANGHLPATTGGSELASLIATERGTMAHRPDCIVVSGKDELRSVERADGLTPCKLCDPYAATDPG